MLMQSEFSAMLLLLKPRAEIKLKQAHWMLSFSPNKVYLLLVSSFSQMLLCVKEWVQEYTTETVLLTQNDLLIVYLLIKFNL